MITIDPGDKKISVYSGKDGAGGSIIGCDSIDMYDDGGNLYTRLTGIDIAGRDFVTLTSRYNKRDFIYVELIMRHRMIYCIYQMVCLQVIQKLKEFYGWIQIEH